MLLDTLHLWLDPVRRVGPEAMAVDEWLLETVTVPTLRVYDWQGDWGSLGYFSRLSEAQSSIPGVQWVRRWSGGGIVDHRHDWTYSLVLPRAFSAKLRSAQLYCDVHIALAAAMAPESVETRLSTGDEVTGSMVCFQNPVCHDLVGQQGEKLAGAGQRRTPLGILHQGSLAVAATSSEQSHARAKRLASQLSAEWLITEASPNKSLIQASIEARYLNANWLKKRL